MKSDDAVRKMLFSSSVVEDNDLMLYKVLANQEVLADLLLEIREITVASYNINASREGLPQEEYKRCNDE